MSDILVPSLILLFLALAYLWDYRSRQKRMDALLAMIQQHRWSWHDDEIPDSVPYRELLGVPSRNIRIYNGFSGTYKGVPFVCADYRIGWGDRNPLITLLAVRLNEGVPPKMASRFETKRIDGWYGVCKKTLFQRTSMPLEMILYAIEQIA